MPFRVPGLGYYHDKNEPDVARRPIYAREENAVGIHPSGKIEKVNNERPSTHPPPMQRAHGQQVGVVQ